VNIGLLAELSRDGDPAVFADVDEDGCTHRQTRALNW
jgi:hypothetical protein